VREALHYARQMAATSLVDVWHRKSPTTFELIPSLAPLQRLRFGAGLGGGHAGSVDGSSVTAASEERAASCAMAITPPGT
jgi:hypothetical protein